MQRGKSFFYTVAALLLIWLVFACLYAFNSFERLENRLYDAFYQRVMPADSRIVIIGADDESIARIGQWPWPRSVMADVVDVLTAGGAAAVGIDVLFDTPGAREENEDLRFAESLERAGNVVLPVSGLFRSRLSDGPMRADDIIAPLDMFGAAALGHVNGLTESDGVVRRGLLYMHHGDELYYSFPYEMCRLAGIEPGGIPADPAGRYYISFTGRSGWYHPLSLADVLDGTVPPVYFRDKLVLIGLYAQTVARDWQFTAIDGGRPTYGVEIQANMLQQMLHGNYIRDLPFAAGFGMFAAFSIAVAALMIWLKPKRGLIAVILLLILYAAAIHIVIRSGYVTQVVYFPAFCVIAYFVALIWHYAQARLNEGRIRNVFGKYMAAPVLKRILSEGEDGLKLGGQRRHITALFVDIRGFTPLSEAAAPEEIIQVLNEFLGLVAKCVHRFDGVLDKFTGDGAMAIWGAPYDQENHALAAVRAAVAMRDESAELLKSFQDKYGRSVAFGIGIHTGEAVIGNIGANMRMDYTAIGDTVNTASRLESNAAPGQILISLAVADQLRDSGVPVNFLGMLKVKGKSEEIRTYEVL